MAQPAPDQPVRDLSDILPSEVLSGGILGALIGSTAAILGDLDIGAVRLAIAGAGVFGALGLAFWISRVAAASSEEVGIHLQRSGPKGHPGANRRRGRLRG